MGTVVAIFGSTHEVIRAERVCSAAGIQCQAVPVPRSVSAGCGIALEIADEDRAKAESVLAAANILPRMIPAQR